MGPVAARVADNLEIYNTPEVASHYAALSYLSPCERLIFNIHIHAGMDILDLGVGGGRTTPYLSNMAGQYVGVDYAEAMIRSCRARYPDKQFAVADASDLSAFPDESFDMIVAAFNGLDYLHPVGKRFQCLRECWRVLRPGGKLIFSSHNPRAVIVIRGWSRQAVEAFSRKRWSANSVLYSLTVFMAGAAKTILSFLQSTCASFIRIITRLPRKTFFKGEGYMWDSAHGGLLTHYAVPRKIMGELEQFGFQLAQVLGDDYPRKSREFITDWYYYVFIKK